MSKETKPANHILRAKAVEKKTGISNSHRYNKLNPDSKYYDHTFPRPIRLGANSVGWLEADIDAWLMSRPVVSRRESVAGFDQIPVKGNQCVIGARLDGRVHSDLSPCAVPLIEPINPVFLALNRNRKKERV